MADHLSETVDDLASSIDELEEVLAPLLATPLSELTNQLSGPLDRAKLQVWLSYVLNDLVWIHLRTRGINPNNLGSGEVHPVVSELDRVKSYFAKIKEAEDPAKRTLAVDGKVANRFIKHALASAISPANFTPKPTHTRFDDNGNVTSGVTASAVAGSSKVEQDQAADTGDSSSDEEPEPGTWKAKKRTREADLAKQRAGEDESEEDEAMAGWEEPSAANESEPVSAKDISPLTNPAGRPKRPKIDPFAGYDQPSSSKPNPTTTSSQPEHKSETPNPESDSPLPLPSTSTSTSAPRKKLRRGSRAGLSKRAKEQSEVGTSDSRKKGGLGREALEQAATKK